MRPQSSQLNESNSIIFNTHQNLNHHNNREAELLADVKDELKNVQQQEGFQIDVKKVKKQLRKVPNWKALDQTKCMDIG